MQRARFFRLFVIVILFVCVRDIHAQDDVVHVVQEGENLFRIAVRYGITVDALMAANDLDATYVYVGQMLVIPDVEEVPITPSPVPSLEPTEVPVEVSPEPDEEAPTPIVHVVQPGENLFRIALRYGITVDALKAANALSDIYIHVGQELVIPGAVEGEPVPQPEEKAPDDLYMTQAGDTLGAVALRHTVSIWSLIAANARVGALTALAGQPLLIPQGARSEPDLALSNLDTYVVRPEDTLDQIALRAGLSTESLAQLNGIVNPTLLAVGQVLRLTETAPMPSGGGKYIVVDLSEQHLYAYQGEELIYSFVASSGAAPYYTRAGEFRVQSKIPNAYGSTWDIWMPHWLGIYWAGSTENGIHALPVMENGATLWAGYLGTPVSYGCIVLGINEAKLLYDWTEIGTPVTIRH